MAFYFTNSHFHCWFSMLHLNEKHIHLLDVQEVVGGDPAPGVGVPLLQPVLEHALLSPDLLMRPLAPALAEQSAHVCSLCTQCVLFMSRLPSHTGGRWSLMSHSAVWVCCVGPSGRQGHGHTGATTLVTPDTAHTRHGPPGVNVSTGDCHCLVGAGDQNQWMETRIPRTIRRQSVMLDSQNIAKITSI